MGNSFQGVFDKACAVFLSEQDAQAVQGQVAQQPAPAPAAPVQDAAQPSPPAQNSVAGFDVYKNLVVNLLRSLSIVAGALASKDQEEITAVQKLLPDNIADNIQQTIGQITSSEPAVVAQVVDSILKSLNPTPAGA